MTKPNRVAVSYSRVSTGRQATEGHSLETQLDSIQRYCKQQKLSLIDHHQDKARTGRTTKRRLGLERAIRKVCEEKGVLVVYSISRLARSIVDASHILKRLQDCGADLMIVDTQISTAGPYGKLVFNIMTAMAEFESDLIGQRVAATQRRNKREKGYVTSGPQPLGVAMVDGKRVDVPEEKELLDKIRKIKRNRTYRAAAESLNEQGVPTVRQFRGGKPGLWSGAMVHNVLTKA